MDGLPYDPAHPPAEPPNGCIDPLLWRVAYALRLAHRPRPDNFCECRSFWPCPAYRLAEESLLASCDRSVPRPRSRSANFGRWDP